MPYKFIIPYIIGEKPWTTGGIVEINADEEIKMLKQAAAKYDLPESNKAIAYVYERMKDNDVGKLYIQF